MPQMNFDLEDGMPPVSFVLKADDCERFMAFMDECQSQKERIESMERGAARWQPIETAPKDGTSVLLCKATDADGNPINWSDDPETAQVFVQVAAWWSGDDEWIVYCSLISEPRLHFEPTHWMPLPAPPAIAQKRGEG